MQKPMSSPCEFDYVLSPLWEALSIRKRLLFLFTLIHTISFGCENRMSADWTRNRPEIRLFFAPFLPLGTPRDSCGFDYVLHPWMQPKHLQVTHWKCLTILEHKRFSPLRGQNTTKSSSNSHNGYPVPPCEGVESERMWDSKPQVTKIDCNQRAMAASLLRDGSLNTTCP